MRNNRRLGMLVGILTILIILFIGLGLNSNNWSYALSRRIPRVLAILLTGGTIALSTVIFQTITNNRILTPSIMGLDSLYLLVQTVIVFFFGSANIFVVNSSLNFLITVGFMVLFSMLLYRVLFKREGSNIFLLLLMGLIFGTLFQSLSSFMQVLIDPNEFTLIQGRMFASFNNMNTRILWVAAAVIGVVLIYSYRHYKRLDVLLLGKENAVNLGIEYDRVVEELFIATAILISISTALVGPITFLGLLVVNLSRQLLDSFKHKHLIISSVLLGSIALIGGQLIVERLMNFKTPLSVVINFIGGLYFIYMLLKENKI